MVLPCIGWNRRHQCRCTHTVVACESDRTGIAAGTAVLRIIQQVTTTIRTTCFTVRTSDHAEPLPADFRDSAGNIATATVVVVSHGIRAIRATGTAVGRADDIFCYGWTGMGGLRYRSYRGQVICRDCSLSGCRSFNYNIRCDKRRCHCLSGRDYG